MILPNELQTVYGGSSLHIASEFSFCISTVSFLSQHQPQKFYYSMTSWVEVAMPIEDHMNYGISLVVY